MVDLTSYTMSDSPGMVSCKLNELVVIEKYKNIPDEYVVKLGKVQYVLCLDSIDMIAYINTIDYELLANMPI